MLKTTIFCGVILGMLSWNQVQAESTYKFHLHNDSTQYTINAFYTKEDGKWSKNWLDLTLKPGEEVEMDWGSDEGNCTVPFKVGWVGYDAEEFTTDWCNLKNLHMKDNAFTVD